MPKSLNDKIYYSAHETAQAVGISKPTLLRWVKQQIVKDSAKRERNGWRLFTENEVETIRKFAQSAK
ncbi:MAG: MerR family transcriptional regulator [Gammaproteobacteria bacterium]|nr:MerR family transcriptional regulator [Gammaproteobacteria bacterium]